MLMTAIYFIHNENFNLSSDNFQRNVFLNQQLDRNLGYKFQYLH